MKWVQAMNNIRNRTSEIVYAEILYSSCRPHCSVVKGKAPDRINLPGAKFYDLIYFRDSNKFIKSSSKTLHHYNLFNKLF